MVDNFGFSVIHFSTSLKGGAGVACLNLHSQLRGLGVESRILTLDRITPSDSVHPIRRRLSLKILGAIFSKLNQLVNKDSYFSIFSTNSIQNSLTKELGDAKNVILHIHNWFNLVDFSMVEELASHGFKMVFTMHDERIFTGGCHYALSCRGYRDSCRRCPRVPLILIPSIRKNAARQKEFFSNYRDQITLIAPSLWIMDEAWSSDLTSDLNISHIRNSIEVLPTDLPRNSLDSKTITLGVASMEPFSYVKGGDFVREIQELVKSDDRFDLIFLKDSIIENRSTIHFWELIDFLIVPSIQDNSPNVIHESKAYGIPVVGSNVGGIPEILNSDIDIVIEDSETAPNLLERIYEHNHTKKKKPYFDYQFLRTKEKALGQVIELYASLAK